MKYLVPSMTLAHRLFADGTCEDCQARLVRRDDIRTAVATAQAEIAAVEPAGIRATPWSRKLGWVGLLAFGQSLLMLGILLFFCMAAGAAPAPKEFKPQLQASTYSPVRARSPFAKTNTGTTEAKPVPGVPIALQLQGILYQDGNPSAMVNNHLLTLNKPVMLRAGGADFEVRAVEITRDRVVIETSGQRVELTMQTQSGPAKSQP